MACFAQLINGEPEFKSECLTYRSLSHMLNSTGVQRKERLLGAVGFGADFPEEMGLKWDFLGWVGFGIDGREGEADN